MIPKGFCMSNFYKTLRAIKMQQFKNILMYFEINLKVVL